MKHGRLIAATATAGLLGTSMVLSIPAAAAQDRPAGKPMPSGQARSVALHATLTELNDSGASGRAHAVVHDDLIRKITVKARGLSPDSVHAQHIHYGDDARNECPSLFEDDADDDGTLNTVEGVPAYGPVVVSLTTSGDTTPASVLAVDRFPVSSDGSYSYSRRNIEFTDVMGTGYSADGGTSEQIADAVRAGEGVVVIHGVDHNGNGVYDFEAGASELDPSLPAEATDPAACGILHAAH